MFRLREKFHFNNIKTQTNMIKLYKGDYSDPISASNFRLIPFMLENHSDQFVLHLSLKRFDLVLIPLISFFFFFPFIISYPTKGHRVLQVRARFKHSSPSLFNALININFRREMVAFRQFTLRRVWVIWYAYAYPLDYYKTYRSHNSFYL